jgi:hypothetical protein
MGVKARYSFFLSQEAEMGGLRFKASLGKEFVRPYLKKQDGCGDTCLRSQLFNRWR